MHRRVGDEIASALRVVLVAERSRDLGALVRVGDDDDAAALAEAAGGSAANHTDDALDLVGRDRIGLERAVHAAAAEDLAELHRTTV